MTEPVFSYDEVSDTLYISFVPGEAATGIELTDHILLRVNKRERRVIGLTLLDYSLIAQTTEIGHGVSPSRALTSYHSSCGQWSWICYCNHPCVISSHSRPTHRHPVKQFPLSYCSPWQ